MVDFEVLEIDVDEDELQDEGPQDYLDRIVKSKVTAAGNKILQKDLTLKPFLVADTVVSHKNKIFGKPTNKDHAQRMLKELSGTTHTVTTGIALGHISESKEIEFVQNHSHTVVEMRSEEHTSELQSRRNLVCRLLLEKGSKKMRSKKQKYKQRALKLLRN